MQRAPVGRIAMLWRGDPNAPEHATAGVVRMGALVSALDELGVAADAVVYSDEIADAVRGRLLEFDGVLVWVDPITQGFDRSRLDPMLREAAARGLWVSAHPDVILKMGTKEVLYRTRTLGWGADTDIYPTQEDFTRRFPQRLSSSGPRVLKQRRGNGGIGTWKVEISGAGRAGASGDPAVRVREARSGAGEEAMALSEFMARCGSYFAHGGCLVDQAFQPRAGDGMVRCYLAGGEVAGFSTQAPRDIEGVAFAMAREKTMYRETAPQFQGLRTRMESDWVPAMQRILSIDSEELPALWDADFLYGPKDDRGENTYVLCEINVSAVFPFPEHASARIARAALTRILSARQRRAAASR